MIPIRMAETSHWLRGLAAAAMALSILSCSDSATGPNLASNNNSPGAGTSTLLVTAGIDFNDNAGVAGGFASFYSVNLRDGQGNPVSGATVTIQNPAAGNLTLAEGLPNNPGVYSISGSGAPSGDFRLDVTRGADNIRGVIVGGPGAHSILAPLAHDTVVAGDSLLARWSVPIRAQTAVVETRNTDPPIATADDGLFWIPAIANPARIDQRLRIYRSNEVNVAGGLSGSLFRVSVRQTVEPYVAQ